MILRIILTFLVGAFCGMLAMSLFKIDDEEIDDGGDDNGIV